MSRKSRSIVWSYFDLLDPNRIYVVPGGYSRIQVANVSLDWGETAQSIGGLIDPNSTEVAADGTPIPVVYNDRWMTPNAKVQARNATGGATFTLNGTMPGEYFTSFSTTYATRVPPFVSLTIEGVDAPDGRVVVLSPSNNSISPGQAGTIFNITDKNMKVRLVDPWGRTINNLTFSATITFLE